MKGGRAEWRGRLPPLQGKLGATGSSLLSLFALCILIAPRIEAEAVVDPALDHMEGAGIEIHHVVFELHRPIVPQGIFRAEAEHPSVDRIAATHTEVAHADAAAAMRPGGAQLAVDKPPIECKARPSGDCRDPIEAS